MKTSEAKKLELDTLTKEFQALANTYHERAKRIIKDYALALLEEELPINTKQLN